LHVFSRGTISSLGDQFHIVEQGPFRGGKIRLVEFALQDRIYALVSGSLNTQEVSVTVQSIGTAIQE
jgi:hypothetical protein